MKIFYPDSHLALPGQTSKSITPGVLARVLQRSKACIHIYRQRQTHRERQREKERDRKTDRPVYV